MDIDELRAELSILIDAMEGEQGDKHEIYLRIREMLANMRALGMPLPSDLMQLEKDLEAEFEQDKKSAP